MRILIEHETPSTTTAVPTPSPNAQSEAENGGGGPNATVASTEAAPNDGGGPPQWLLDAVGRAMAQGDTSPDATVADADGGAAPNA